MTKIHLFKRNFYHLGRRGGPKVVENEESEFDPFEESVILADSKSIVGYTE